MARRSLSQIKNTYLVPGEYTHTSMVSHRGTVVSFGMTTDSRIKYAVLDMSPNSQKVAGERVNKRPEELLDRDCWSDLRDLAFPAEIAQVGYGVLDNYRMPQRDHRGERLTERAYLLGYPKPDPFHSTTARLSAKAPFQVLSDSKYIYVFRQSLPQTDSKVDKVGPYNVPIANSTLLADRFVLTGTVLKPCREVRYQRSRHKTQPASRKDTLSSVDMEKRPFYEPTREIAFVRNLSEGCFSVLLIPTEQTELKRWQIFYYDRSDQKVNSISVKEARDGWFDTTDSQAYIDQFLDAHGLGSEFVEDVEANIRLRKNHHDPDDGIAAEVKGSAKFPTLKDVPAGEVAEVVYAMRTGIVKDDFSIKGQYKVATGMSSIFYYQQELDPQGKPMKTRASVMLAMGLDKELDQKNYVGVLNFAVSTQGRLSRLAQEDLELPRLKMTTMDETDLLKAIQELEQTVVQKRAEIVAQRKQVINKDIPEQRESLRKWSPPPHARCIDDSMISELYTEEKILKHTTSYAKACEARDEVASELQQYRSASEYLKNQKKWLEQKTRQSDIGIAYRIPYLANGHHFALKYKCESSDEVRVVQTHKRDPMKDLEVDSLDAVVGDPSDSKMVYFFKGELYWKWSFGGNKVEPGYPRQISEGWPGLPDDLDAALQYPCGNRIYFFKGEQCWRWRVNGSARELDDGYPRDIDNDFPGLPHDLTTAIRNPFESEQVIFAKGEERYVCRIFKLDECYDVDIYHKQDFLMIEEGVNAAFTSGDIIYVFTKGTCLEVKSKQVAKWETSKSYKKEYISVKEHLDAINEVGNHMAYSSFKEKKRQLEKLIKQLKIQRSGAIHQIFPGLRVSIPQVTHRGTLLDSSPISLARSGCYARWFEFTISDETAVTIHLEGGLFKSGPFDKGKQRLDTYLYLRDKGKNIIAKDNDGGDHITSKSSWITRFLSPGTYIIEATTRWKGTGDFDLTVAGVDAITEVEYSTKKVVIVQDDIPTLDKLASFAESPIQSFYNKIANKLGSLADTQRALNDKQKKLKSDLEAVNMPVIEVDTNGLATSGGLLEFAYTASEPILFDDSLGRVSLFFQGQNDTFFSTYFNPTISRTVSSQPEEQDELAFTPRLTIDMTVSVAVTPRDHSCDLTIKDTNNQNKRIEHWRYLPSGSRQVADVLNGRGAFVLGVLVEDYRAPDGTGSATLTITCARDQVLFPTNSVRPLGESGQELDLSEFLTHNRALRVGNRQFSIAKDSKVRVNAGWCYKQGLRGVIDEDQVETLWNLLKTNGIIVESQDNQDKGRLATLDAFGDDATLRNTLKLPAALKHAEQPVIELLQKAAATRHVDFQVTDDNIEKVAYLAAGLDVYALYDYSNYSCIPDHLTGIGMDTWAHSRSFLFRASAAADMDMKQFTTKRYTIEQAMGQWEAYDPGLAIDLDRALETEKGQEKVGLLTTVDPDKLTRLQPTARGLTLEAWICPRAISEEQETSTIIAYQYDNHNYQLGIEKGANKEKYKCFAVIENKKIKLEDTHSFGTWTHLALTYKKYWGLQLKGAAIECGHDQSLCLDGEFSIEILLKADTEDFTLLEKPGEYKLFVSGKTIGFTLDTDDGTKTDMLSENPLSLLPGGFTKITLIRSRAKPDDITSTKLSIAGGGESSEGVNLLGRAWYEGEKSDDIIKGMAKRQGDMIEALGSQVKTLSFGNLMNPDTSNQGYQPEGIEYYYTLVVGSKIWSCKQSVAQAASAFSNAWIGNICTFDEVRLWNRALSLREAEQFSLANNKSGLTSRWRMSEGTGKFVYDDAGRNHGIIRGETHLYEWVDSPNTTAQKFRFYVDGKRRIIRSVVPEAESTPESQLSISGYKHGDEYHAHFNGTLEEIRIWGMPRSAEQICDNMFGRLKGEREHLLANYTFDTNLYEGRKLDIADLPIMNEDKADRVWDALLQLGAITADGSRVQDANNVPVKSNEEIKDCIENALYSHGQVLHLPLDSISIRSQMGPSGSVHTMMTPDRSSAAHTVTLAGRPVPVEDSKFGRCLSFRDLTEEQYIEIRKVDTFPSTAFTVCCWVKVVAGSSFTLLSYTNSVTFQALKFVFLPRMEYQSPYFEVYVNDKFGAPLGLDMNSEWHHLAFTWSSSNGEVRIYHNGSKLSWGTVGKGQEIAPGGRLVIGGEQIPSGSVSHGVSGELAQCRIYNRVLHLDEIAIIAGKKNPAPDKILDLLNRPHEIDDLSYNSATLTIEGQVWNGVEGRENVTQVLSTAPIYDEIPEVRSALSYVKTDYHGQISSSPAVVEYGDVQQNDDGTINGILKRCYSYIHSNMWRLVTGYKVGNLITEWYGQAQYAPQVMGYMEGAPPVPGENFPVAEDSDINIYAYHLLENYAELEQSSEVRYNYTTSKEAGYRRSAESEASIGAGTSAVIAPFGFGVISETSFGAKFTTHWETTGDRSQSFERGASTNTDKMLSAGLAGFDNKQTDSKRYYTLGNTGYALVKSKTADIYLLRLAHNHALVSMYWQPNPDVPEDTNIITFPINPLYVKQGTLDGKFGETTDEHYPQAHGAYGEYSYFKPREAYRLKRQIEREQQKIAAYYRDFETDQKESELFSAILETDLQQLLNTLPLGVGSMTNAVLNQALGAIATRGAYNKSQIQERLARMMSRRNLVNTYVWTVEGGFYDEDVQVAETRQETYSNSFGLALGGSLGITGELELFGVDFEQQALLGSGTSITMTQTKTKESTKSFGLNVSVDMPTSPRYRYDGRTLKGDLIAPGTVDAYRFMSFYLEPQAQNYIDLFTKVIDPKWLDESPDPNANALRQARNDAKKPFCWRVMYRVTFVSRILPEFEPEAAPSLQKLMRAKHLESNYALVKLFEPYVKPHLTNPGLFFKEINEVLRRKLPEFAEYSSEIADYLALYFGVE